MRITHSIIDSPLGPLTLVAHDGALAGVHFDKPRSITIGTRADEEFHAASAQLGEYFRGERTSFDLELRPSGREFDMKVWELLRLIPYGEVRSYGQLAEELGNKLLAREVGAANSRNPIAVIVPCHRVIGSDGSLVGYAGGLDRKRFLLELENAAPGGQFQLAGLDTTH